MAACTESPHGKTVCYTFGVVIPHGKPGNNPQHIQCGIGLQFFYFFFTEHIHGAWQVCAMFYRPLFYDSHSADIHDNVTGFFICFLFFGKGIAYTSQNA